MAPPRLVSHYETHREFVEHALQEYETSDDDWEHFSSRIWMFLPELPDWWLTI